MTSGPGRFLLLGSGEFEAWASEAERFALAEAPGDGSVAVLATASAPEGDAVFERWIGMGLAHYKSIDVAAQALRVRTRSDALDTSIAKVLDGVSMVFFSGGSPKYLAATLRGTVVWDATSHPPPPAECAIHRHRGAHRGGIRRDAWRVFGAGEVDVRHGRERQSFLAGQWFPR